MSLLLKALVATGVLFSARTDAQGVTTAAISGVVARQDSAVIEGAVVTITNSANGERWQTRTKVDGRYFLEYLSVGGPYVVEARAIGFRPAQVTGVLLSLGERRRADLVLTAAAIELQSVQIMGHSILNAGSTGPAQTITGDQALALPVPGRDFSQLTFLSPQAVITGDLATSFAGLSDRLNGLQIDGTSNSDLGGISGLYKFGTAGALNGARTLSIESLRELQVLVAPFDVRYGMFAGGLVNAVTRSGSNRWEGSVSSYYQTEAMTGRDSTGRRAQGFSNRELTLTLAGPIVTDRAAFYFDVGVQRVELPSELGIGRDTTAGADSVGIGVRRASAERFQRILRDRWGVNPGSIDAVGFLTPAHNVFGKLTLWPRLNQRIELSYNYAYGSPQNRGGYFEIPLYSLSSKNFRNPGTVNGTRLTWAMARGDVSNELLLSRLATTDRCEPTSAFPDVRAFADAGFLRAGQAGFCDGRFADNTEWSLTNNLTWFRGSHHLLLGLHAEALHLDGLRRLFQPQGIWNFSSLDSLESGLPNRYRRDYIASGTGAGASDLRVHQVGMYLQDQWLPIPSLTITAGARFDVPFLPTPVARNQVLFDSLGVNSSLTPGGNVLWSPRLGFNYDVNGRGTAFVRGGAGLFAGRPIYLFFSDVYETAALDRVVLDCRGSSIPAFTLDLAKQPKICGDGSLAAPITSYFDPGFRFPRNLRVSVGADVTLPSHVIATADVLYIKGVDQLDVVDANLAGPLGTAEGEGGRVLYGAIDAGDGNTTPTRRTSAFGRVPEMRNGSGDRSISVTGQLRRRVNGSDVSLAYTYTDARDRMSAVCSNFTCNLDWVPVDGTLENRRLATARFESAHKVTFSGVLQLPARFQLGVFYNGFTGIPYTFLVSGDPNADGLTDFGGNDAVYVPRDAGDISLADPSEWTALDRLISESPCLRAQRGHVLRRNSCRDHWLTLLNARVTKRVPLHRGKSMELTVDLFNALNLLNRNWGVQRRMAGWGGDTRLLELVGYDDVNERGVYRLLSVDPDARDVEATRWRLQTGLRLSF